MSFFDKMKKTSKSVVDAGAKAMLKVCLAYTGFADTQVVLSCASYTVV